jgi:hypothetical protein
MIPEEIEKEKIKEYTLEKINTKFVDYTKISINVESKVSIEYRYNGKIYSINNESENIVPHIEFVNSMREFDHYANGLLDTGYNPDFLKGNVITTSVLINSQRNEIKLIWDITTKRIGLRAGTIIKSGKISLTKYTYREKMLKSLEALIDEANQYLFNNKVAPDPQQKMFQS